MLKPLFAVSLCLFIAKDSECRYSGGDSGTDGGPAILQDGGGSSADREVMDKNAISEVISGNRIMGEYYSQTWTQASALMLSFTSADVGKYVHIKTTSSENLGITVVKKDRSQSKHPIDYWSEQSDIVARVGDPYPSPRTELQITNPGTYTVIFYSYLAASSYLPYYTAAPAFGFGYTIRMAPFSIAKYEGESIYIVESTFPSTVTMDDSTSMSRADFVAQSRRPFSEVFEAYVDLVGAPITTSGTMVGVRYPPEPDYPYCGDASSPIKLKCVTLPAAIKKNSAFAHELGHVFTLAFPFIFTLPGGSNVETGANYFRDYLSDPMGGKGMTREEFLGYEAQALSRLAALSPGGDWAKAMNNDGLLFMIKNHAGGWGFFRTVMRSYSSTYAGPTGGMSDEERGKLFVTRLVQALPDLNRREQVVAQLRYWGFTFLPGTTGVDLDNDGFVAGLDRDDIDPLVNPRTMELHEDGVDENGNGYVDEYVLRMKGETVKLGETHSTYDLDRATRRRLYFKGVKGRKLTISLNTNGVRVGILLFDGNRQKAGPWWWDKDEAPLLVETAKAVNQKATHVFTHDGPYTVELNGLRTDGVQVGHPVAYTVSLQ